MKIAIACNDMTPQNVQRQPWFYMNMLAKGLTSEGHDVWILTDVKSKWPNDRKFIVFKNFRIFPKGIDNRVASLVENEGFNIVIWSTGLTDFFFKNKIDVLKIPVIAVVTSPRYFLKELLLLGKDLILNRRFIKQFFLSPFVSKKRMNNFLRTPNLKAVVFECNETLKRYISNGVEMEKAIVIPPPIPEDFLNILDKNKVEKNDYEKDCFKILYFGPPITLRGIDILIQAMNVVSKKIDNVKLDILSRVEHKELLMHERKIYESIRKMGLEAIIRIISGMLSPREILKHIHSSDLVCLPFKCVVSDVPITVLETLATDTPLITTDVAGVSEFARNGRCYIVPPNDPKSLAEAIIKVKGAHKNELRIEHYLDKHNQKNFTFSFNRILREAI